MGACEWCGKDITDYVAYANQIIRNEHRGIVNREPEKP